MVDSSKMSLEEPYKIRLQNAAEWSLQNPKESVTTAARIYHVKDNSVRVKLQRMAHQKKHVGGQNRVLSDEQSAAVLQYMRDKLNEGLGATKQMTYAMICHIKALENPHARPPTWRWFQIWLKDNSFSKKGNVSKRRRRKIMLFARPRRHYK
jgi:hypothetical protein